MKTIVIEIPDELWEILQSVAKKMDVPAEHLVLQMMLQVKPARPSLSEEERRQARERLLRFAGSQSLGYPTGADNESIDADLVREYGSSHEEDG